MKNLITCLIVCVLSGVANATIWTVDDDGKADFNNIQAAIDAASDGDTIAIAEGTYYEVNISLDNKTITIIGEIHPDGTPATVIDGQSTGASVFNCLASTPGETNTSIIENLYITGGLNNGAGMRIRNASPTVNNCTFAFNHGRYGGAMSIGKDNWAPPNTPTLNNCTFANNTTEDWNGLAEGGAIYNLATTTVNNCTFTNNQTYRRGGAISNLGYISITNCTIQNNEIATASFGGGVYNINTGSMTITNSIVCGNIAGGVSTDANQVYGTWTNGGDTCVYADCNQCNPTPDDLDGDGILDDIDNCYLYNPDQEDCNENNIGDPCDLANGTSYDINGNGIPDDCEDSDGDGYPDDIDAFPDDPNEWIDTDGDGVGDNEDTAPRGACCVIHHCFDGTESQCDAAGGIWLSYYKNGSCEDCHTPPHICAADLDGDGEVKVADLLLLIAAWGACP